MSYNQAVDRTFRINGSLSIDGIFAVFVQGITITVDATVLQRDSIGTGTSIFTQNGDVIGSFSFSLKNTIDLYETTTNTAVDKSVTLWMQKIKDFTPAEVVFIQTINAPKATSENEGRITFTGRIMTPEILMAVDNAIEDVNVTGEITIFTSAVRDAPV